LLQPTPTSFCLALWCLSFLAFLSLLCDTPIGHVYPHHHGRKHRGTGGAEGIPGPLASARKTRGKMAEQWRERAWAKRGRGGRGLERPRAGACGQMLARSRRGGRGDTRIHRKGHSSVCQAGTHTDAAPSMLCLQRWLNGASLRCACSCTLTELPCVLLRWHTLCLAGYHACTLCLAGYHARIVTML
jgi:hypothetical protein